MIGFLSVRVWSNWVINEIMLKGVKSFCLENTLLLGKTSNWTVFGWCQWFENLFKLWDFHTFKCCRQ